MENFNDTVPLSGAALSPAKYFKPPRERGGMDRYYGRPFSPHYYAPDPRNHIGGRDVGASEMTPEERKEYEEGFEEGTDKKDWG